MLTYSISSWVTQRNIVSSMEWGNLQINFHPSLNVAANKITNDFGMVY